MIINNKLMLVINDKHQATCQSQKAAATLYKTANLNLKEQVLLCL